MTSDVYICGCSFSTGFYRIKEEPKFAKNIPYPVLYCNKHGLTYTNLAFESASNYAIAKQVEYAISQKPKLILVNLTSTFRFDFTLPGLRLNGIPRLADIVYNDSINPIAPADKQAIYSMSFSSIVHRLQDRVFNDYVVKYADPLLVADQDKFIVAGMYAALEKSGINHAIINFVYDFASVLPKETFYIDWGNITKKFPIKSDPNHFNDKGHEFLTNMVDLIVKLPNQVDKKQE